MQITNKQDNKRNTAKECNTGPYTEILLKVALNTITLTLYNYISFVVLFICNLHCINPVVVFWFMVFNATFNNIFSFIHECIYFINKYAEESVFRPWYGLMHIQI
jgi:hypothetical protein